MQEFKVTVTTPLGSEPVLPSLIKSAIYGRVPGDYIVEVDRYDPENERKDLGTIQAIKRIRQELKTSLVDSKFLTDTAKQTGFSRWANVRIIFHDPYFQVIIKTPDDE
jgi:hypothetical protein